MDSTDFGYATRLHIHINYQSIFDLSIEFSFHTYINPCIHP
jgi:hypothetical protein